VQRLLVDRLARADLAELAQVDHPDPVADLLDQGQVVRNEQVGEAELAAEPLERVKHLGLDQQVERGDRLVADQQVGVERDGARDRDPLRLAAGQLPRVPPGVPGRVEADQVEQLVDPLPARLNRLIWSFRQRVARLAIARTVPAPGRRLGPGARPGRCLAGRGLPVACAAWRAFS
jgi:hypothetical protein